MKSPREYLRKKYPEYESERGLTGHDDEHMERLMLEYAEYYAAQHSVQWTWGMRPVPSIIYP